jgi:rpsU-divergently transcribed protein
MREEMGQKQDEIRNTRIKDRIHQGIRIRLHLELPYEEFWPQAMALGMHPQNLPNTLQQIHAISDEIWFQAGDKAVDVSRFSL